jgi:hypothetical protein
MTRNDKKRIGACCSKIERVFNPIPNSYEK